MDITNEFSDRESFLHWFIIASITGIEMTDELKAVPRNLTMQLNGVDIDPLRALNRLEEEYYKQVENRANELVEDAKNDILNPFQDKVDDLTKSLNDLINEKIKNKE